MGLSAHLGISVSYLQVQSRTCASTHGKNARLYVTEIYMHKPGNNFSCTPYTLEWHWISGSPWWPAHHNRNTSDLEQHTQGLNKRCIAEFHPTNNKQDCAEIPIPCSQTPRNPSLWLFFALLWWQTCQLLYRHCGYLHRCCLGTGELAAQTWYPARSSLSWYVSGRSGLCFLDLAAQTQPALSTKNVQHSWLRTCWFTACCASTIAASIP